MRRKSSSSPHSAQIAFSQSFEQQCYIGQADHLDMLCLIRRSQFDGQPIEKRQVGGLRNKGVGDAHSD